MINLLNMYFNENQVPDFGNITVDKNGNFALLQEDVFRLLTNVTRDVCGTAFNVPTGQRAVVVDTGAVFIYHSNDRWYLNEPRKFYAADTASSIAQEEAWKNPERYHAGYVDFKLQKDNANYLLNDETVTLTVTDKNNNVITEQTITNSNYMGDGYYVAWLNILEARQANHSKSNITIDIEIMDGETDITSTFDIHFIEIKEWIDKIEYGV